VATTWKPKSTGFDYFHPAVGLAGTLLVIWRFAFPLGAIVSFGAALILDLRVYAKIKVLKAGTPSNSN
jgi:hypothetical protein